MKRICVLMLCAFFASGVALAKRSRPKVVTPVVDNGVEYSAPITDEGFVLAKWIDTGRLMWKRQIYVVKKEYKYGLDADVQTCYISEMSISNRVLYVVNERKAIFGLDLDSLEITVIHGSLLVDNTSILKRQ